MENHVENTAWSGRSHERKRKAKWGKRVLFG